MGSQFWALLSFVAAPYADRPRAFSKHGLLALAFVNQFLDALVGTRVTPPKPGGLVLSQ
jgi:hypothetical protein